MLLPTGSTTRWHSGLCAPGHQTLYPPSRPNLPPRLRLIEKLNQGLRLGCTLTLISVPAGFGKTTLVTVWLTGLDHPRTWLSLDENDNDPARFFTYLVAALQGNDPSIGQTAQAMLQSPEPPLPETYPASLINDMAITSHSFLFVTMLCQRVLSSNCLAGAAKKTHLFGYNPCGSGSAGREHVMQRIRACWIGQLLLDCAHIGPSHIGPDIYLINAQCD